MLYRQTHQKQHLIQEHRNVVWFSPVKNYAASYGCFIGTFVVLRDLHLLDLGNSRTRKEIVEQFPLLNDMMDPNYQYSGSCRNRLVHEKLYQLFNNDYDGTFIDSENVTDEQLEGATEVVLWGDIKTKVQLKDISLLIL